MAELTEIVGYLNSSLRITEFADSSLNGLQVEGAATIQKVAVSVDAGQAVVQAAAKAGAQALIVHHGLFWSKPLAITGPHRETVSTLLQSQLNLLAYHLPLDAHAAWGNNFSLGRLLKLTNLQAAFPYRGSNIGCTGELASDGANKQTVEQLAEVLANLEGALKPPLTLAFGPKFPERIGIVSGAGADALYELPPLGIDTFITGEPRQFAYHFARENKLNVIFAGHYATETLGVIELGKALEKEFKTQWEFINLPTGI